MRTQGCYLFKLSYIIGNYHHGMSIDKYTLELTKPKNKLSHDSIITSLHMGKQ
jgi:hypothetical protein